VIPAVIIKERKAIGYIPPLTNKKRIREDNERPT
jgi:hypothetical protein